MMSYYSFSPLTSRDLGKLQIISIGTHISGNRVTSLIPWQPFLDTARDHIGVLGVWICPFSANLIPPSFSEEEERRKVRSRRISPALYLGHSCHDQRSGAPDARAFPLAHNEETRGKESSQTNQYESG